MTRRFCARTSFPGAPRSAISISKARRAPTSSTCRFAAPATAVSTRPRRTSRGSGTRSSPAGSSRPTGSARWCGRAATCRRSRRATASASGCTRRPTRCGSAAATPACPATASTTQARGSRTRCCRTRRAAPGRSRACSTSDSPAGRRSAILEPELRGQALGLPPARSRQPGLLRALDLHRLASPPGTASPARHGRTHHGHPPLSWAPSRGGIDGLEDARSHRRRGRLDAGQRRRVRVGDVDAQLDGAAPPPADDGRPAAGSHRGLPPPSRHASLSRRMKASECAARRPEAGGTWCELAAQLDHARVEQAEVRHRLERHVTSEPSVASEPAVRRSQRRPAAPAARRPRSASASRRDHPLRAQATSRFSGRH